MEYAKSSMLYGSYKLSEHIIRRLTSVTVIGEENKSYNSASRYEIGTLLYFSHVCDPAGVIKNFRTSSLAKIIGCSDRQCANIIENLRKKQFISIKGEKWTGLKTIRIVNNDFSNVKKYTHQTRYLNTSSEYFDRMGEWYQLFMQLSVNAMRLFIYVMYNYSFQNGYRVSILRLMQTLGIRNKYTLLGYMDEMESLLGKGFFMTYAGRDPRIKYDVILIKPGNRFLVTGNRIDQNKDSSFSYDVNLILQQCRIRHDASIGIKGFCYRIFSYIYQFLETNNVYLTYERLLDIIRSAIGCTENLHMAAIQVSLSLEELCQAQT